MGLYFSTPLCTHIPVYLQPFELGITDNPISSAHSRLVAPYCEQWTELSPSITIQEEENTPYTCNCELLPDHHLGFPSREGETAAYAIMEYTNSEPQAHCPVPGSRGNQMLPGQGKGAGTAEGIYVWVHVYICISIIDCLVLPYVYVLIVAACHSQLLYIFIILVHTLKCISLARVNLVGWLTRLSHHRGLTIIPWGILWHWIA